MSLINEALKKAQQDRPQNPAPASSGNPGLPPETPQPKEKRQPRGFLWGFILAVILVGSVSSLLAAYLVIVLIDPQENPRPPAPTTVEQVSSQPVVAAKESEPAQDPADKPASASPEELRVSGFTAETQVASGPAPKETQPGSATTTQKIAAPKPAPPMELEGAPSPVSQPLPPTTPYAPNPEVVARLRELEIRGVMSGATKVLIHDTSTGKTKAFRQEESLEGTLGLVIVRISNNKIEFRDYAGQIHSKSF